MEYRLRRHDGEYRWLLDNGVPRHGRGGEFAGYVGTCLDIHDRKRAEQERADLLVKAETASREAEAANRSKDEFLATVSHELRTPLNAILGWAQLLLAAGTAADDPERRQRGLETVVRNAKLQSQLIDDLLDVSRIISGKMRLDVQSTDLAAVIDAAVEAIRPAAEAKQLQVRRVVDPFAGPVTGDPVRLQQVVWNLLSNAVKFTPKAGKVEVRLERVNSHIEILVADNGAGIAPDFLPHVFDRFRQVDASTTRRHGGLGLGLAIVRHLVELHGGTVRVKSPGEGEGSTFIVALPLSIAHLTPAEGRRVHPVAEVDDGDPCEEDSGLDLRGIRVLVVDDEPDARETLRQILEHCNAEVETVGSAAEAVKKPGGLAAGRPALGHRHAGRGRLRADPPASASCRPTAAAVPPPPPSPPSPAARTAAAPCAPASRCTSRSRSRSRSWRPWSPAWRAGWRSGRPYATSIRLRRQNEIVLAQASHRVGPQGHLHPSPGEEDVGVMPLALGDLAQAVDEVERLAEVLEAELLLQVVLVGHRPAELELAEQLAQLVPLERSPFGGFAGLGQQLAHLSPRSRIPFHGSGAATPVP